MKKISLTAIILAFALSTAAYAENVDIQKFLQETQKMVQGQNSFRLVWWIPTEFWEESFRNNAKMPQSQKEAFYKAVDDYVVLAVADAKVSELGSIMPVSKEEIVNRLSLSIGKEIHVSPLPDSKLNSDAKNLFSMMKPLIANMLGQFGKGLVFVCFQGKDMNGKRLLDPKSSQSFSIKFSGDTFNWRLPLGSLLPAKVDAATGEEFPGNYIYNPFTGSRLIEKK
jgi:hypothetical protein